MSDIRLIVFDLGRVLVRICEGWQHACEVAKLASPLGEVSDAQKAELRSLVAASERGQMNGDEFCRRAGEVFGQPPASIAAISDIYLLGIYPGVTELLDELHMNGYQTACLSNTNPNHWRLMSDPAQACCLPLDRLTYQFGSHLIGARKPEAAIYAHVERETGLSGAQLVFFDDLPENVEAARRRGWCAHQILPEPDPVTQVRRVLAELGVLARRG